MTKVAEDCSEKKKPETLVPEEVMTAISSRYASLEGKLDVKFLWISDGVQRVRANWYVDMKTDSIVTGSCVIASKFLYVENSPDGIIITEKT